jgi:hypothetical protein
MAWSRAARFWCIRGKRPRKAVELFGIKSGEGDCPFFLQGPFSEPTVRSAEHELPLTNPMGKLDTGDRDSRVRE